MVEIRQLQVEEAEDFWNLLKTLDVETTYMMYEPEERERRTNLEELRDDIRRNVAGGNDFLQVAIENNEMVGYIRAERGRFNRIFHTAYIVIGVLNVYSGKGIGTAFFEKLDAWAKENGIVRLELTVECRNLAAKHLYEKAGFQTEGRRVKSMLVDGRFVDEYYMAKIL